MVVTSFSLSLSVTLLGCSLFNDPLEAINVVNRSRTHAHSNLSCLFVHWMRRWLNETPNNKEIWHQKLIFNSTIRITRAAYIFLLILIGLCWKTGCDLILLQKNCNSISLNEQLRMLPNESPISSYGERLQTLTFGECRQREQDNSIKNNDD